MKQQNQNVDLKKGSADCDVSGSKKGMPGGDIGRGSNLSGSARDSGSSQGSNAAGRSDYGGPEGNSRERKSARNGSDSDES